MLINAVMPIVTLFTGWLIPFLFRWYDRKFTSDAYITRQTSMGGYKAIHLLAEYSTHSRFANSLLVVYVSMLYGVGLPILFPIAAFNFFNSYICERIAMVYQIRLPPLYDEAQTINCIEMLRWSPILMLMNAYWMLENKQIFNNQYFFIDTVE